MHQNIILLGPPGSGKGTQSENLIREYNFTHLSTGNIIRDNMKKETKLGLISKQYVDQGNLVPDDLVIEMVEDYIKNIDCGIIWDGFPRTLVQAEKLDELLTRLDSKVDYVLLFEIDEQILFERLSGRLICPMCNRTYHKKFQQPKQQWVCDVDNAQLVQRKDDEPDKIKVRLESYKKDTEPLIAFYQAKGCLKRINVDSNSEIVWQEIEKIINTKEMK